ncbi:hypothetical protein Tcan_18180 [Toxocara canis]|uniref:Domain of unknown function DB domain-containing protein n=1 Tax=Toxocara canis TaxID=6265 RepID=A0A0B2V3E0_TOXCA|nr:hypothetical protein Tcan_18180 [Toxocara canis]
MWSQFWVLHIFVVMADFGDDPFDKALFECQRMSLSLCCTSRVRENCLDRCGAIQCAGDSFYKQVIDRQFSRLKTQSRTAAIAPGVAPIIPVIDRQFSRLKTQSRTAAIAPGVAPIIPGGFSFSIDHATDGINSGIDFRPIGLTTFRNGKNDGETSRRGSETIFSKGPPLAQTSFPTLITSIPVFEITQVPENNGAFIISATSVPSTVGRTTNIQSGNSGGIPDRSVLQPPDGSESLVHLSSSDYDTDPPSIPVLPLPPPIPPNSFIASSRNINPNAPFVAHLNRLWSVRITPHGKSTSDFGSDWGNIDAWKKVDAKNFGPVEKVSLEKGISAVIGAFISGPKRRNRINNFNRSTAPTPQPSTSQLSQLVSTTSLAIPATSVTMTTIASQCGIPPHFLPCVSTEVANSRMLQCCRAKQLPVGCQNLCRYDVTQAEIKAALDAAQCGILYVAPIVECASGGHDNIDCCRYKQIAIKSGPQCEVFCRAGDGIKGLGLQHLICNTVMNDLIICHHAGLRP